MQVEEESPKQYVDIARGPDEEMRPDRPVPFGVAARRHAEGGAVPARSREGATPKRATARRVPRVPMRACTVASPKDRGPCSTLRRAVCCVALLDNIDRLTPELIQELARPSSGALHTVRPGHNASRAYI